jgi:hypothetical protein
MLPVVNVVGNDLETEVRQLSVVLGLDNNVGFLLWVKVTVFELDVLLYAIEVAVNCGEEPAWGHDELHSDVGVVCRALDNVKVT